jgi:hypothetical protein
VAKWNWTDEETDVTPRDIKEAWAEIDAMTSEGGREPDHLTDAMRYEPTVLPEPKPDTVRDTLVEIIRQDSGVIYSDSVDRILDRFAVIPKEPTEEGTEADVPGWIVDQIKADAEVAVRADLHDAIEEASALAFSAAERDVAMYLKGWNEALAAVDARGRAEVEPIVEEDPAEDIDEAMRQADA